jgi:uncharacterized membrane protein YoaT (DUF817 family)
VWLAENIGTFTRTWAYPDQAHGWHMVSIQKMGAWGLLLVISFVVVTLVVKVEAPDDNDMACANYASWWAQVTAFFRR